MYLLDAMNRVTALSETKLFCYAYFYNGYLYYLG